MDDILGRAQYLGIKFGKEEEEDLSKRFALQELLADAICQRNQFEEAGLDADLQDRIIEKLRAEINGSKGR